MRIRDQLELWVSQEDTESFFLSAGPIGVLMLHGFTGTPREMLRIGRVLHKKGITVSAPLLPGHGATIAALNRCNWRRDWVAAVETAYAELAKTCSQVFVAGLSMGALLALWLAAHHPEIPGLLLYSPALWAANWRLPFSVYFQYLIPSFPAGPSDLHDPQAQAWGGGFGRYPVHGSAQLVSLQQRVRRLLPQIKAPTLLIYSKDDRSIHPRCGPEAVRRLGSRMLEVLRLEDSGHMLTADQEWRRVAEVSAAFVVRHAVKSEPEHCAG